MRVLIIEDDMKMRGMLKDALETVYRIDTAQTIGEALEWIESCSYGAVLLDRNLCGEDNGMEIIPKLKKRHPSCAVMIASAYGGVEERIAGLSAGADDYLEKPYDLRELRMRLDGLIRRFAPETITSGGVCLDLVNQTITAEGKTITLSKKRERRPFLPGVKAGQGFQPGRYRQRRLFRSRFDDLQHDRRRHQPYTEKTAGRCDRNGQRTRLCS